MKITIPDKLIKKLTEECAEYYQYGDDDVLDYKECDTQQLKRMKRAVEKQIRYIVKDWVATTEGLIDSHFPRDWWPIAKRKISQ